jgi:hypothetical protein
LAGGWIGFDWLRIETGGALLLMPWWTFGFLPHGVTYIIILSSDFQPSDHY